MSWIWKQYATLPIVLLALIELSLFIGSLLLLLSLYPIFAGVPFHLQQDDGLIIAVLTGLTLACMFAAGLYNRDAFQIGAKLPWHLATSVLLAAAAFATFLIPYSLVQDVRFSNLYVLAVFASCAQSVLVFFVRALFVAIFDVVGFRRRLLLVGGGPLAAKVQSWFSERDPRYTELLEFDTVQRNTQVPERHGGSVVALTRHDELRSFATLPRFVHDHSVDEIVVAGVGDSGESMWDLLQCRMNGVTVTDFHAFWERETGRFDLDAIKPNRLVYSGGFCARPLQRFSKRTVDLVASTVGLVVASPVIALAALVIKLDSPGPVLYRQERVGRNGQPFQMLKLRTMRVDAEIEGIPRWAAIGDARMTRVGALLRRARIDEFPQLVNVLRGEMSLVGPRPERPAFVAAFERQIPLYSVRHSVRPGLSGWAQINYKYGASLEDAKRKLEYDLFYVKNYSLLLDVAIILQTARVVLWLQGGR
jgi:sugar transferase (PEP-CTERM system associated)